MSFFLGIPSGSPKIGTLVVPKLWLFIYFSNQVCFENAREISYSPQKDLSNNVYYAPNWISFDPFFSRICGQESNSQFVSAPSFDHNSCKLDLNEQCKGILNIYTSRPF
jgi:hypothetical protein